MPGGLLNIAAYGAENVILTGNPKKTFFNATYKKYTNFGLQRFRLDYEGQRTLNFNSQTEMVFKIPRYAELLWDTYLVVNLPDIWSPLYWTEDVSGCQTPYEFQWTKQLGSMMIHEITVYSGANILSRYSGEYLEAAIQRDDGGKKILWNRMVGANNPFSNPAQAFQNGGFYPNAAWNPNPPAGFTGSDVQPSIKGRRLYIPLEAWFTYGGAKTALPLVALQYQEVHIKIRFRSIKELYTIRDVKNVTGNGYNEGRGVRIAPNAATATDQLYWFLQPPQDPSGVLINAGSAAQAQNLNRYVKRNNWDADIHLMSCYIFLSQDERRVFAANKHTYLVRETFQHDFLNVAGSRRVDIPCRDMVPSFMFRFRRSDANERNAWFNYSNWPYEGVQAVQPVDMSNNCTSIPIIEPLNPFLYKKTGALIDSSNLQSILLDMGILLGSEYRETILESGVYNLVEKWIRTDGIAKDGLYCYNFAIRTNRDGYQPSGAQNMNKWQYVTFEFNTVQPPFDPDNNNVEVLCDPSGGIIGVRKDTWRLNQWNFDLRVWEERYNMIVIENGSIGLLIAR